MGPNIKLNPLYTSVYLLVGSYIIGEFIFPKYPLIYIINLFGIILIIISIVLFFSSRNAFFAYDENPLPHTDTEKIIKTLILLICVRENA